MDKAQLRRKLQDSLVAMRDEQRQEKSHRACERLIATEQFQEASVVMLFLSLPHEVDTSEAILHAWHDRGPDTLAGDGIFHERLGA